MSARPTARALAAAVTLTALAASLALAGCGGGSGDSGAAGASAAPAPVSWAAGLPASDVFRRSMLALVSAGSVHVADEDLTVYYRQQSSSDITASGGRDVTTGEQSGDWSSVLLDGVLYVRPDAKALTGFFNVVPPVPDRFRSQWFSVRPGQRLGSVSYDDASAGLTLGDIARDLGVYAPWLLTPPTTVDGQPVVGLKSEGPPGLVDYLYVSEGPSMRPVMLEISEDGQVTARERYSEWGEKVDLARPADAIPAPVLDASVKIAH